MSVTRMMNRLRNRSDVDEPWRRNFLERLADLDQSAQTPTAPVHDTHEQHPAYSAYQAAGPVGGHHQQAQTAPYYASHPSNARNVDSVLYGFADALKNLDAAQRAAAGAAASHSHAEPAASSPAPTRAQAKVTSVVAIPEDCLAYWDQVDEERELVKLAQQVQNRARRSIRRGVITVAASSVGLAGLISGFVWLQISNGADMAGSLMSSFQEPDAGPRQNLPAGPAAMASVMMVKPIVQQPQQGPRRDPLVLASTGPRAAAEAPSRYAELTSAVFENAQTGRRLMPPGAAAHALNEARASTAPASAQVPAGTPAAAKRAAPVAVAAEVRIESPALANVDADGQVAVALRVTSTGEIPTDAYVLIEALPSGLVPAVGLHVAHGVWKLEPDELESFALIVGSSAPEFFAFTISVFAADSTSLGRSTAAVALRYTKRRQVLTTAAVATSVVRTDSEAQRDAKLVAPPPQVAVHNTVVARVEAKTGNQSSAPPVATTARVAAAAKIAPERPVGNVARPTPTRSKPAINDEDDEATAKSAQTARVVTKPPKQLQVAAAKPVQLQGVTDAKAQRREQPGVELKMAVGAHPTPLKPMAIKPSVSLPTIRPPTDETNWKRDVRDSTGVR
jgi:hypothetical protein